MPWSLPEDMNQSPCRMLANTEAGLHWDLQNTDWGPTKRSMCPLVCRWVTVGNPALSFLLLQSSWWLLPGNGASPNTHRDCPSASPPKGHGVQRVILPVTVFACHLWQFSSWFSRFSRGHDSETIFSPNTVFSAPSVLCLQSLSFSDWFKQQF